MARKAKFPPDMKPHASGQARVHWRGRDYWLGKFGSAEAKEAYRRLILQISREESAPKPAVCDGPLIYQIAGRYYWHVKHDRNISRGEVRNIKESLFPLCRQYGCLAADLFDTKHLEQLQHDMATGAWLSDAEIARRIKHKKPIGWCANRVNDQTRRIRTMFRWAERRGYVSPGKWAHLRTVGPLDPTLKIARDGNGKAEASSLEDVQTVAAACSAPVGAMLMLQWWTGCRSGEVRIIRTMDLDMSGEIWRYKPGSELTYGRHKNAHRKQHRVILIGKEGQEILRPWLKPDASEEYLFTTRRGNCFTKDYYGTAIRRVCERIGVKVVGYGGRHAAKMRIARQFGIEAAAAVLGHKTLAVTENYGELDLDHAEDVMRDMG